MNKKQKLELTWIGKDEQPVLEPRILIEDPTKSYGDPHSENMLIHGDNLLALKALEQKFAGKIKCIFIDPPYNTGSAFKQYDDGIEHSLWLSLIRDRLIILRNLLSNDGSLWITIDDTECHYLKVLCDELFGRQNFVCNVIWEKKSAAMPNAVWLSDSHDHVLVYAKDKATWRPNKLPRTEAVNEKYDKSDEYDGSQKDGTVYGRGPWFADNITASLRSGQRGAQFARTGTSPNIFEVTTPSERKILPPAGTCWRVSKIRFEELLDDHRITFGPNGSNRPCLKRFLSEMEGCGLTAKTVWHYSEVGENRNATAEVKAFNEPDPFSTPKPEGLVERVLTLSTQPDDIVLDSFLGSGTTVAVAQKMRRKWIGIELGDHCDTHCLPRLLKVCDGTDQGGISKAVEWKGGGGFKYYDLAPSLLRQDKHGNFVISEEYNADMMAAAMAKQEGFTYAPSQECYWKQGFSTEQDFIFTTTNHVTHAMLDLIAEELAEGEHLLICCKKFSAGCDKRHLNIQVKKIPAMLMGRCEFGKEDYSLNIVNLTDEANAPAFVPQGPKAEPSGKAAARTHGNKNPNQLELF
jgi:adenine-specific DNA-methyltransferase